MGGVQGQQPGIIDKINEWKEWSIKNKSEIAKGGTERMNSDMMVQNILRDIQKAKDADKFLLELGKAKFEGKYDPDDDDINVLDKASKSIYDQQHYKEDGVSPYSWGDLSTNVPDYDINKAFETGAKGMKGGKTYDEGKGRRDPQTGLEWIPYTEKFSDAQIPQIAKNVASEYNTNKSAKKYWDTQFKKLSEDDYKKLNATYKQYFPQETIKLPNGQVLDMSNIDTAEELAIASSALRAKEFVAEQGEVPKSDYERKKQDSITKLYIQDGLIKGRQQGGGDIANYDVFKRYEPKYATKTVKTKKKKAGGWGSETVDKTVTIIPYSEVDVNDKKLIGEVSPIVDGADKYYIVREDGDWEGKGGQVISRANAARKNMDATSINEVKRGRLSNDITPTGQQPVRTPKDIKTTKMTKKGELD